MSEPGYTGFNMDDEYEDGNIDEEGFFTFARQKQPKRLTKEEQIYGIFTEDFDDYKKEKVEEDPFQYEAPQQKSNTYSMFRKCNKVLNDPKTQNVKVSTKASKNLKKSVQFSDKNQIINIEQRKKKRKFDELYEDLGQSSENSEQDSEEQEEKEDQKKREELRKFRIFQFTKGDDQKEDNKIAQNYIDQQKKKISVTATQAKPKKQSNFWETKVLQNQQREGIQNDKNMKQTYGQGYNLLKKFGWAQGKGLGKNEDGINKPVEAAAKNKLSLSDNQKSLQSKKNEKLFEDSENEEDEQDKVKEVKKIWKKTEKSSETQKQTKFKGRYFAFLDPKNRKQSEFKMKNPEDPTNDMIQQISQGSHLKIIDMRGPNIVHYNDLKDVKIESQPLQQQSFQSYDRIIVNEQNQNIKNLSFNIKELEKKYQASAFNLENLENRFKFENDKLVQIKYEQENAISENKTQEIEMNQLQQFKENLIEVQKLGQKVNLQTIYDSYKTLFYSLPQQFVKYKITNLFVQAVQKSMSGQIENIFKGDIDISSFNSLEKVYTLIKNVMIYEENESLRKYQEQIKDVQFVQINQLTEKQERLLKRYRDFVSQKSLIPPLRTFILGEYDPLSKNSDILQDFFIKFQPLISEDSMVQIHEQLLIPKLLLILKQQNLAKENQILPHHYLIPIFQFIKDDHIQKILKHLLNVVQIHTPQLELGDILNIISPFTFFFDKETGFKQFLQVKQQFYNFLKRFVLPKLVYMLEAIDIEPDDQKNIKDVLIARKWTDIWQKQGQNVDVLWESFLEKIKDVMIMWKADPDCVSEEVDEWVKGWKYVLGDAIWTIGGIDQMKQNY